MRLRQNIHWFLYPLFLLSCAKQTAPTGGPKDTIPPVLVTSRPYNQQTNFNATSLQLTFNESLVLNNPKEQIIITPDLGNKFEAQAKKNTISIKFDAPFIPNTTYSLNFRDAIQDITEKNPAENLKLAFSTGTYIDSLTIAGTVLDLLKATETKDATVALYQTDTFNIFRHKPTYFTKTDPEGRFQLTNLKPGNYFIYAFDDKNKNLIVESKSESYGYLTQTIDLTSNTSNINIPLVRLDTRPLKLTSARPSGTYFNIKTSKNLEKYKIKTNPTHAIYSSYSEDHSNIRVYTSSVLKDSLLIRFYAIDSVDNTLDTILYLKSSTRITTPEKFQITESKFRIIESKNKLTGHISFNKPLLKINYDSLYYQTDSTKTIKITAEDIEIDSANNTLHLNKTFPKELLTTINAVQTNKANPSTLTKPGSKNQRLNQRPNKENQLYIGKATFISIESDSNSRSSSTIIPTTLQNTGSILATINTKQKTFLLQLTTRDYKVIATAHNNKNPIFEDLEPGEYRLRLIIDENKDEKWNPGNFDHRTQPEKVVFYKNEKKQSVISLKANWELGPLLITY